MRGRSLQTYPVRHRRPSGRKRQRPRGRRSGGLGLIPVLIGALVLAGASFGAVFVDWNSLMGQRQEASIDAAPPINAPQTRSLTPKPRAGENKPSRSAEIRPADMTPSDARDVAVRVSRKGQPSLLDDLESKAKAVRGLGLDKNTLKVDVAGVRLRLEPPKGQCLLDPAQQADARVIGMIGQVYRGELRAIHGFADCNELKAWRAGERTTLGHYGDYLIPVAGVDKTARGSPRTLIDTACRTMREYNGEYNGIKEPGLKERIEKALEPYKMNQVRLIGVIDQDDVGCYFSTVQKTQTENGEAKVQINVAALALIGGKMLYIDLYSVLENDSTMQSLLLRQKANVVRNIAANGS